MASSKKKAIVSKDDLRRLMKEKQSSLKPDRKRIDSPLARYNALGQLSCVLCNTPVKNELLWNAHIIGRTHKENLARLKAEKEQKEEAKVEPPDKAETKKRKLADEEILAIAKGLKPFPSKKSKKVKNSSLEVSSDTIQEPKPRSILKTSTTYQQQQASAAPCGDGGPHSPDNDDVDDDKSNIKTTTVTKTNLPNNLPPDFFETGVEPEPPPDGSTDAQVAEVSETLPEGFFDDPKQDAKVRQVEYRDKMDEEWEMFQRAINEETYTSEAIQAEDDEVANEERNLLEVEEQLKKWSEIDRLAKKKEKLVMTCEKEQTHKQRDEDDDSDDSVDEQDYDEFLDWRSKKAWK